MESNWLGNNNPSDTASDSPQRAQPLPGNMSCIKLLPSGRAWTAEEDEKLRVAVEHSKGKSWINIGRETNLRLSCCVTGSGLKFSLVSPILKDTGLVGSRNT